MTKTGQPDLDDRVIRSDQVESITSIYANLCYNLIILIFARVSHGSI